MTFSKLFIFAMCATVACCEENCIVNLKNRNKNLEFDLTRFKDIRTVNSTELNDFYSINLCKSNKQQLTCNGSRANLCLIENNKNVGFEIKELKLDIKDQLIMSLEGNTICKTDQKYTADIIFICDETTIEDKIVYKLSIYNCKYIIELISVTGCPVNYLNTPRDCDVSIPKSPYKFNLYPLRRLTDNYLVKNQNRSFEVNICGSLTKYTSCDSNITMICDVTDTNPKVYAVWYNKNKKLSYDVLSQTIKLMQYEYAFGKQKGRGIEFTFKCDENIPPEKTKPEFLNERTINKKYSNVAYFEVATSIVCLPKMTSCEIFADINNINLKPLHKQVGNWEVNNEKTDGGQFYLNVCDYLNQYDEDIKIPSSCIADGKTSICYKNKFGQGISVGSTQNGPYIVGNSILLNYTDGIHCNGTLKWSSVINFICSNESQLIYHSTNLSTCTHSFQWKTDKACKIQFNRESQCLVTQDDGTVYNMSSLKHHSFEVNDDKDYSQFRFSVCSPLQTPCNGYVGSSVCWSKNGTEKNIGAFTDQLVFDNGKIYTFMNGEKCINNGPDSYTTVRFICDYSDSKSINYKKNLSECTFDFEIHTKYACTLPSRINCTVEDELGNFYDLSNLTKLDTNYEISYDRGKKIILNVCHSVINSGHTMDNNIDVINCQLSSGVCLVDSKILSSSNRYKTLGDVKISPYKDKDIIKLKMLNGFYNGNSVSSVIEFVCSYETKGPELLSDKNYVYTFRWLTPLACPINRQKQRKELPSEVHSIINSTNSALIDGVNFNVYVCSKNDINSDCHSDKYSSNLDQYHKSEHKIILTVDNEKKEYTLGTNSCFVHNSNQICDKKNNQLKQIEFKFICDTKQQRMKITKEELCKTDILIIDPKICDKNNETIINIYLDATYRNDYSFISISTETLKTNNYIENKASTKFEFINLENPMLKTVEVVEKSKNINAHVQQEHGDNFVNKTSTMGLEDTGFSFFSGLTLLIVVFMFLAWIYRWKLLKKIRRLFYSRNLVRRRRSCEHFDL